MCASEPMHAQSTAALRSMTTTVCSDTSTRSPVAGSSTSPGGAFVHLVLAVASVDAASAASQSPRGDGNRARGRCRQWSLLCGDTFVPASALTCTRQAPSLRPRRSLGAICSLVAGGGTDAASSLRQDLNALTSVYRATASADLLAFHDGQLRPRQQRKLATEFSNLHFVLLDDAIWRVPLDYVLHERFYKRRYTDELGPRDTARWLGIRFWMGTAVQFAVACGYSWVMRVGRGARILSPIAGDLFEHVAQSGAWYAYRLGGGCEPVQRADFFRLVQLPPALRRAAGVASRLRTGSLHVPLQPCQLRLDGSCMTHCRPISSLQMSPS